MSPYWTKRRDDVKDTATDLSVYVVQGGELLAGISSAIE